jgi:16S rRNA (cytosine967-C5)-methyltransferase
MSVSPARLAAFNILLRVSKYDSYAQELLHSEHCTDLSPADMGLTTELVMGVLRWQAMLDSVIAKRSSQKITKLDSEVLVALRLGAYQLGWLDRIPAHAAIHESVELVKAARKRSAVPFANAILRRLSESRTQIKPDLIDPASTATALASLSSHPQWIVDRWVATFGWDVARTICEYDQRIPATTIRLRDSHTEELLQSEGVTLASGQLMNKARRVLAGDITATRVYGENRVAIQDEASQLVAATVGSGSRILDCCAAPGGKTWAIADRNPQSLILAVEVHHHRAHLLKKRMTALNVLVVNSDARRLPTNAEFDRVLVDAPCSGTGTVARNPEIKWRLTASDLSDLSVRQRELLKSAMEHVSTNGRVIYATCSLEEEEGERVIESVLRDHSAFRVVSIGSILQELVEQGEVMSENFASLIRGEFLRTIPGIHDCDGFFAAVLERVR